MRVFSAGIATETNTFATLPTGMGHFVLGGFHRPGLAEQHGAARLSDQNPDDPR